MNPGADLLKTHLLLKYFLKFLLFLALAGACREEDNVGPGTNDIYFPLRTGFYQVYHVNEVRYSVSSEPSIAAYEIMTEVADSFPSAANEVTYVIHRSRRDSETQPWEILDTWSARREGNDLIVSEGNVAFVKLRFPVRDGVRWNGNSYNAGAPDEYEFTDLGQRLEVNGLTFEETVRVEQESNEDLIVYRDVRSETYAPGVGLVYREITQLNYCTDDHCIGQQKIDHGIELKMTISDYGMH